MKFTLVLVLSLVAVAHGQVNTVASGIVASVRQYPSFLHKCSAFFISPTTLVSTATCLLCADKCEFYVAVYDTRRVDSNVQVYSVNNITLHPDFMKNSENNLAVITLERAVPNAVIYSLPTPRMNVKGLTGKVYSFLFDRTVQEYSLQPKEVTVITNEICSDYLDEFVSEKQLCFRGKEPFFFGPTDLGSPAVFYQGGQEFVLGVFTTPGIIRDQEVIRYLSIFPHVAWIKSLNTGCDLDFNTVTPSPTEEVTFFTSQNNPTKNCQ